MAGEGVEGHLGLELEGLVEMALAALEVVGAGIDLLGV